MGPRILRGWFRPGISFGAEDLAKLRQSTSTGASPLTLGGSFVYVIRGDHNRCKIGISSNPTARIAQLRTASPFPLSFAFLGATKGTDGSAIEREAHIILDRYRASGEWFDCPVELAVAAVNAAAAKLGENLCSVDPAIVDQIIHEAISGNAPSTLQTSWPVLAVSALALTVMVWILGHLIGDHIAIGGGAFIAFCIVAAMLLTGRPFLVAITSVMLVIAIAAGSIIGIIASHAK